MAPPLITLDEICLTFGGTPLFEGASINLNRHDRIALVGRNGSGKSTFLKIAAGFVEAQDGMIFRQPGATICYLEQAPDLSGYDTVEAYVQSALGPTDDIYKVHYYLESLGLNGDDVPTSLSGGEARRAALARILAPEPDILLLDEPTNHLDITAIEWLEGELQRLKSAMILISHDRRFLERVSRSVVWLDRGKTRRMEKGFGEFEGWRDIVLEEEARDHHKLGRKIAREDHWVTHGVSGRRKRNMRRLGELQSLRESWRSHRGPQDVAKIQVSQAQNSGKLIIEAKNLCKSYGERKIVDDFSLRVQRGDRIGLVGPNGAGKTTLLKLLIGQMEPDSGSLRLGAGLEIASFDQTRSGLDPKDTPSGFLTGGRGDQIMVDGEPRHVVSYLKDFLFSADQALTPIKELSGGEKARLLLAKSLAMPSNFLILDEPTNDLDMETLDLLQELVANYAGTVLLVSHDRDFLDRTVAAILAPDENGQWITYAGGYSDMVAQRGATGFENLQGTKASNGEKKQAKQARQSQPNTPKVKLSYKQKYALESLPVEIEKLEEQIAILEGKLADPAFFLEKRNEFDKVTKEMDTKRMKRDEFEEQWIELETLREQIEG